MEDKNKVLEVMSSAGKALKSGEIAELKKEDQIVSPKRCYWEPK